MCGLFGNRNRRHRRPGRIGTTRRFVTGTVREIWSPRIVSSGDPGATSIRHAMSSPAATMRLAKDAAKSSTVTGRGGRNLPGRRDGKWSKPVFAIQLTRADLSRSTTAPWVLNRALFREPGAEAEFAPLLDFIPLRIRHCAVRVDGVRAQQQQVWGMGCLHGRNDRLRRLRRIPGLGAVRAVVLYAPSARGLRIVRDRGGRLGERAAGEVRP